MRSCAALARRALAVLGLLCLLTVSVVRAEGQATHEVALVVPEPGLVKLGDTVVCKVYAPRGARSPTERALGASRALASALKDATTQPVRISKQGEALVVQVGERTILDLYPEDATLAGAPSLDAYARDVASDVAEALDAERRRGQIANTVFSVSLVILFALIAVYVVRKLGELTTRAHAWIAEHPEKIPAIQLRAVQIVSPPTLRSALHIALGLARWALGLLVAYSWLVVVLSLFAETRGYTERLTGFVLTPLSALTGRIAASLPVLVVLAIAALAILILVRFIGLLFASVARQETTLSWLPPDLAAPTGVLLRLGIVLSSLLFAAPIVTGGSEGMLSRAGLFILGALTLAATPLLASAAVGTSVVFARRLRPGDYAEIGGHAGRVTRVGLLEVHLLAAGVETRVPHLLSLLHPTRVFGEKHRVSVDITIEAHASAKAVVDVLVEAAKGCAEKPKVEIVNIDPSAVHYRVLAWSSAEDGNSQMAVALHEALQQAGLMASGTRRR